ncbi:RDD family protein [Elongatibacter sediminis]|uniref:RDD family protein n=1 Tax=Elongatibacter sediminis TaxID=3119006 RepID=A0AAW9RND3_9GAMM
MPDETPRFTSPAAPSRPCGLLRRLLIMLYDTVVVVALWMLTAAALLPFSGGDWMAGRDPLYTAVLALVWFAYLAWSWRRGGMTLGMRAWRVRLATESGSLPGWRQCAIRFLTSLVSAAAAGSGFLVALFDRERRTWHDRMSRTSLIHQPRSKRRKP